MPQLTGTGKADTLTGTNADDVIRGGGGDDVIKGLDGKDDLSGGDGDDRIYGGDGADKLEGGIGDDLLDGGAGADLITIRGEGGADIIRAGSGNDIVRFIDGSIPAELQGGSGVDLLRLDAQWLDLDSFSAANGFEIFQNISTNNGIYGNDNNNVFDFRGLTPARVGPGFEVIMVAHGRGGDDIIRGMDGGNDILHGDYNGWGDGDDKLYGYAGDDFLYGEGGDDFLYGGAGDDTLDGGAGNDTLKGEAGDDYIVCGDEEGVKIVDGGDGDDQVELGGHLSVLRGGAGVDTLLVLYAYKVIIEQFGAENGFEVWGAGMVPGMAIQGTSSANVLDFSGLSSSGFASLNLDGLDGNDTLIGLRKSSSTLMGGAGDDRLTGGDAADRLVGGAGADVMRGGKGDDTYEVDSRADVIVEKASAGIDTVISGLDYVLGSNLENLTLTGSARTGVGNAYDNVLIGNSDTNTLDGKAGADRMAGGAGDDTYHVDNVGDRVQEVNLYGDDHVISSVSFSIGAYIEQLTLSGSQAINGSGNKLANTIIGNGQANTLTGNAGADTLTGGAGADTFDYNALSDSRSSAFDRITDLSRADRIDVSTIDADTTRSGNQAFAIVDAFTNRPGQITLTYAASTGVTTILMDVNGDGRADMKIVANGDHHDFTNFVL